MKIKKAVITVAGDKQRNLPLQTLVDRDGTEKTVLRILIEEVLRANIENIYLVISPEDEKNYKKVVIDYASSIHFVPQEQPLGYGHAICCAQKYIGNDSFLHLVGDHLYVSRSEKGCAQELVELAENENCSVSAVQATREHLLTHFGTVGGRLESGHKNLYRVESVSEKPTPTEAEQRLIVPGLRVGYYLCFQGMHVLSPLVMDILNELLHTEPQKVYLSHALDILAKRERYLAFEKNDLRYDVGVKYGLLTAQLALAFNGKDRDDVLSTLLSFFATREIGTTGR